MSKLRVFTAFSGYDSQCMALDRLGIPYELIGWAEIDKFAIQAHNAVYPQYSERNYGDISKINWDDVPEFDLFTYSSPCQDFSNAGKKRGGEEGSGTRSSLLWECRRAIIAKRPKYLVFENVASLVSRKFIRLFNQWQHELQSYGYYNHAKVLDAKDYGIPQHRERVIMVSILRTDEDPDPRYFFPRPFLLKKRLGDVLEKNVDESYYLSEKAIKGFMRASTESYNANKEPIAFGYTRDAKGKVIKRHTMDVVNTIHATIGHGGSTDCFIGEPVLHIPEATTKGYAVVHVGGVFDSSYPESKTRRGRVQDGGMVTPTITRGCEQLRYFEGCSPSYRIRKLTPRECFRLMGVDDEDVDRIQQAGISNSQQFKLAGNSIVVDMLENVFRKLFIDKESEEKQLTLF